MSVIRLRAGQACPVCGSTMNLPHASLRDCESVSERDAKETVRRPGAERDSVSSSLQTSAHDRSAS